MIAIHHREGSFSDKWIEFCEENNIQYRLVNCYQYDIIDQVKGIKGLMWHWPHWDVKAQQFARQLTFSLEKAGIKVFPNSETCWHYDDKVGQKYLLEALDIPFVHSYTFYDEESADIWAQNTNYPKVFKSRRGAGSTNVKLVNNYYEARKLISKSFGIGIPGYSKKAKLKESIWEYKRDRSLYSIGRIIKYALRYPLPSFFQPDRGREQNYTLFQEFIPDNKCDVRVIVIGHRAFAIKRLIREGDFRASGSGKIIYDKDSIPKETISTAFEINKQIKAQSIAFDFVLDKKNNKFLLIEISYAFTAKPYHNCPGYWDDKLNWHEKSFYPEKFMIDDFINEIMS